MAGVGGEDASATAGGSGKMQWQVNEKFWKNFAPSANRKLEMYRAARIPIVRVWDGNLVRELDLRSMECHPGRIGLRRVVSDSFAAHTAARIEAEADQLKASEPVPCRPASVGGSRAASLASRPTSRGAQSSSRPNTVSSSRPNTVSGSRSGSRMLGNGPRSQGSDLATGWDFWSNENPHGSSTSPLAGLRLNAKSGKVKITDVIPYLNHPIVAVLEPPSFSFVDDDATKALTTRDPGEMVVVLASLYAEQLMSSASSLGHAHAPKLPVPAGVPPDRVMAALSLALHKVVALLPPGVGFQEGDADSVCSPLRRGRRNGASPTLPDLSQDVASPSSSRKQNPRRKSTATSKSAPEKLGPIRIHGQIIFVVGRRSEVTLVMSHKLMCTWNEWVEKARSIDIRWILEDNHCKAIFGDLKTIKSIFALVFACASIWEATLHYYSQGQNPKGPQFLTRARVQPLPADALQNGSFKKAFHFATRHPLTEATALAVRGEKVVLGMIGSGTLIGGHAFCMDTADTLEDEVCCCTTLYIQLMEALRIARNATMCDSAGNPVHIPEDGALLLRDAWVLRHPSDRDYAPLDEPLQLTGIALYSLPNYTHRDMPARGRVVKTWAPNYTKGSYFPKMRMLLHGAIAMGATVIVMSTDGAEELGHDPALIGAALAEVIESFKGAAPPLHLIGQRSFKQGVVRALRSLRAGTPE